MSDADKISYMQSIASNPVYLQSIQHLAAQKLLAYDGEIFPRDGCAITLSTLMQHAGIAIADVYTAIDLGGELVKRGWTPIKLGQQQDGDVGSTCGEAPRHGFDHIYFVLSKLNDDEMVIADNQASQPHFRFASGNGKTPTTFFLRATETMVDI